MLLYRKNGRIFEIIAMPEEKVNKGEYLLIEDPEKNFKALVQVVDFNYIDVPGLLEELIREGALKSSYTYNLDLHNISRTIKLLRDTKVLTCILRGYLYKDGQIDVTASDLPSRISSKIIKIPTSYVAKLFIKSPLLIILGEDQCGNKVAIDATLLDGSLTLITGMKGMGKSHLAKLLAISLVDRGAPILIFDINGEYIGLSATRKVELYYPGKNLFFTLKYLGKDVFLNVMIHILNLPGVSANILSELWSYLERKNQLTISEFIDTVNRVVNNLMIKDAITSRLLLLLNTCFISDNKTTKIEDIVKKGKGIVIVLRGLSAIEKKILVEVILSKLTQLLERECIPPLFLFAEEAHMYIRDTYWEDIITRMRHFGLYVVFITNQPDSIDHKVFRQIDNIFIFKFINDHDLEMLSKVSNVDVQTIKTLVRELSKGECLIVGRVVNDIPIIINVLPLTIEAMGESKKVFKDVSLCESEVFSAQS